MQDRFTIPSFMHAVVADATGGPDVLRLGTVPVPAAGPGELLVRVWATALNRADLLQRAGHYPPPAGASTLLGLEMAGEVVGWGADVAGWQKGERVCALLPGGGYAQYVTVPETLALQMPEAMTYSEAAAIPETFLTAFQALYLLADLEKEDHVLLHAGASGVGTAVIQLARQRGAHVHATASAPKHAAIRQLGAETTIDYEKEDFAARIDAVTGGHGADVIIDFIGASYAQAHVRCLALDGRWVVLATMGGGTVESFDLRGLFAQRGALITSTLRNRSARYKAHLTARFREEAWPGFASGALFPVVDRVYDWRDVQQAHQRMEERANVGKIVLKVR